MRGNISCAEPGFEALSDYEVEFDATDDFGLFVQSQQENFEHLNQTQDTKPDAGRTSAA